MDQLKRQWDQDWDPDKTRVSRETLKDNAIKSKKKVSLNEESICKRKWRTEKGTIKHHVKQNTNTRNSNWANEMKINLSRIEKCEQNRGRGFMNKTE